MTKDEASLRLLEECYSIKQGRAMDRIENLMKGLYPIVGDWGLMPIKDSPPHLDSEGRMENQCCICMC